MGSRVEAKAEASAHFLARAYTAWWRVFAGTLVTISGASLPVILVLVLLANDPPITPPILVRLVVLFTLLPGLVAWILQRAFAASVALRGANLVVRRRDLQLEIPCHSIEGVVPWVVPIPGPGLALLMRSGRRFRYGLQVADPVPLLEALADGGAIEATGAAWRHGTVVYAHAKQRVQRRRWYHRLGKFVGFALLPAAVLFYTHQHIAYGGPLGEYHLLGLRSYLRTFVIYWSTVSIYLVLYASVWRGMAEGVNLLAAWSAGPRAAGVRRATEIACRVLYYGGVPVLLLLRYLP